jgi:N utilization substance protein B
MFESIIKNEEFLIEVLTMYAPKFDIENMDLSYVLPIFIGTTEILIFPEEIPVKVSINEAVEISKIYGDDSSRKMVNGVLNNVLKNEEQLINKFKLFKSTTYKNIFF